MKEALEGLVGVKGDLLLIGLSTLIGFLLCCIWVVSLKYKLETTMNTAFIFADRAFKAEAKLPIRDNFGKFTKKFHTEPGEVGKIKDLRDLPF